MASKIILKTGKDKSLRRKHPWIFSGAIKKMKNENGEDCQPQNGEWVQVFSNRNEFLGAGHYQNGSIAVRILGFEAGDVVMSELLKINLEKAFEYRKFIGITSQKNTDCFRLVHGEGDSLSGLIIDVYGSCAVIQCHSFGMYQSVEEIATYLKEISKGQIQYVYSRSKETLGKQLKDESIENMFIGSECDHQVIVKENNITYQVNIVEGQKTGFFLDQRENRKMVEELSKGKRVLNTFCYSGGFTLNAVKGGSLSTTSIDASQRAIDLCNHNMELNKFDLKNNDFIKGDTLEFLKDSPVDEFDLVILDPPAYAKSRSALHNAIQGYKRLNAEALLKMKPGSMLMTFSCSQLVSRQLFYDTLVSASIVSGRTIRVVRHLAQPSDHPVSIYHPEGGYLKGLLLHVS